MFAESGGLPMRLPQSSRERLRMWASVIQRYLNRISGPLLDRIDLHVEVTPVTCDELSARADQSQETSAYIRKRGAVARKHQEAKFKDHTAIF